MTKQEKGPKSGFVIKLSNETVQKLVEEDQQAKSRHEEVTTGNIENIDSIEPDNKAIESISADSDSKKDNTENVNIACKQDKLESDSKSKVDLIESVVPKSVIESDNKEPDSTSWGDHTPYITYEGEVAIYTDPSSHQKYIWNKESNSWELQEGDQRVYSYEDDTHIYTEVDGSKFFWDVEKKAWIPKIDDEFIAYYQMSYGFIDNKAKDKPEIEEKKKEPKKAEPTPGTIKRKQDPQWFQPCEDTNTKVYVSNLPLELTEEEFVNYMQKCGLVERDPSTQKMKVKLYMDKEQNCFKGDALCTYIKIESVDLALKLLDGGDLKGNKVKVERASFQMKGEYNPALKPKKKKKKELEKLKKMQQKLFDWRPEKFIGERSKHERVVIVKNLFHPTDFDKEVQLILDYQQDLREECTKCGEVRKVVIYDRHPEGVAQITMKEPEMADSVVQLINGRWFGKRQITAEIWDGRTKYRIAETDSEISKRIGKWDQFLEGKDGNEGAKKVESDSNETSKDLSDNSKEISTDVIMEVVKDVHVEDKPVNESSKDSSHKSKDKSTDGNEGAKKVESDSNEISKDSSDNSKEISTDVSIKVVKDVHVEDKPYNESSKDSSHESKDKNTDGNEGAKKVESDSNKDSGILLDDTNEKSTDVSMEVVNNVQIEEKPESTSE